jgi:hypothetical protein
MFLIPARVAGLKCTIVLYFGIMGSKLIYSEHLVSGSGISIQKFNGFNI